MTATTTGSAPAPPEALRNLRPWDALLLLSTVGTSALVAFAGQPLAARLGAVALVVACGLGWFAVGRRMALHGAPTSGTVLAYCVALGLALLAAVALVPQANWAAFVVVSQVFWLLTLVRAIVAAVLLTAVLPVVAALARGEGWTGASAQFLPQALFMTVFGILVGVYIHRVADESEERAELIAELRRSQAEVAELSHATGVAAERERLAGEIHDTLAQGFTSIVTLLQAAQAEFDTDAPAARRHVELAVRAAKENLQEARHLVAASAPGALAAHPLGDAIARQVERFAEETGADAAHGTSGTSRRLPAEQEIVLLRAAQELLANVARHAGAGTVTVRLDFAADATSLTVADDGVGFAPDRVEESSYGLAMMRSRVERLAGSLDLDTAPGAGTTVTVHLPNGAVP